MEIKIFGGKKIKMIMRKKIDVLVRAIIKNKGKILVCRKTGKDYRGKDYYFFPGGHIEFGERAGDALKRELKEELGIKIKKSNFIGGSEHTFVEDGKEYHEINLVFNVLTDKINTVSKENHLQFFLMDKKQLAKERVLPKTLTRAILKWLADNSHGRIRIPRGQKPRVALFVCDKKPFWVSQINK